MKRSIFKIMLSLVLVLSFVATPMMASASYMLIDCGDANMDQTINVTDVVLIRAYIVGIKTYDEGDNFFIAADANEDGDVDIIDVVKVRGLIVNDELGNFVTIKNDDYNLYINGEHIVEGDKIVGTLPEGVSFEDKVLTLNNATIEADAETNAIYCDDDLTIVCKGSNYLTGAGSDDYVAAISAEGNIIIEGDGSLVIKDAAYGITANFIININCDINIHNVDGGITAGEEICVDNCLFDISAFSNAISCIGNINITGSQVALRSPSAIMAFGYCNITDCPIFQITANANTEDELGAGIITFSEVNFKNTYGTIAADDITVATVSFDSEIPAKITFDGVKIDSSFKYDTITEEADGMTASIAVVTEGELQYDENNEIGIANAVTYLELMKP